MADTLTDAENRYSGIPTIRREMAAYSLPEPLFENRRGEFVVTLRHSMEPAEPSCDGAQTDLLSLLYSSAHPAGNCCLFGN